LELRPSLRNRRIFSEIAVEFTENVVKEVFERKALVQIQPVNFKG
jgi:hypothetical protein